MPFLMTLAGASVNDWIHFTNSITQGTPDSPIRGSIGISYGMSQNICQLYEALGKDDATFLRVVQTFLHATTRTPTTAVSAKLCLTFVKWMSSPNDTFVIRKSTKGMWIARRSTPLMVDMTHRYPLRFHYTVVGPVTADIQTRIDAAYSGAIMPAVLNV
jgi:hypothetical protein